MQEDIRQLLEHLTRFNLNIRHDRDMVEAVVPELNEQIQRLYQSGFARQTTLVGEIIARESYDPGKGPEDSGQIILAVLALPGGLGVARFDSEELYTLQQTPGQVEDQARTYFSPYDGLDPLLQGKLRHQVGPLVTQMIHSLGLGYQ